MLPVCLMITGSSDLGLWGRCRDRRHLRGCAGGRPLWFVASLLRGLGWRRLDLLRGVGVRRLRWCWGCFGCLIGALDRRHVCYGFQGS